MLRRTQADISRQDLRSQLLQNVTIYVAADVGPVGVVLVMRLDGSFIDFLDLVAARRPPIIRSLRPLMSLAVCSWAASSAWVASFLSMARSSSAASSSLRVSVKVNVGLRSPLGWRPRAFSSSRAWHSASRASDVAAPIT